MPGSPEIGDRTWFGIARCTGGGIEIEGAIGPWSGHHDNARLLVVDDRGPLEWLLLAPDQVSEAGVAQRVSRPASDDRPPPPASPPAGDLTVVVCTRDRPESLRSCLSRIRSSVGRRYQVMVVDNCPRTDANQRVVEDAASGGLRVVRVVEPRPGLSRARNCALARTTTEFVAFTDDDALPDVDWAGALHRGFSAGDDVALVTGIVPPAQIETRAQALFEQKLKWSNNLAAETYSMARRKEYGWPFPYSAGHFGTGANFAVDRQLVLDLGGFDEALGVGTRTQGGEDLEMFVRVLRAGHSLRYEPSAVVWHVHSRDERALRRTVFGYGKGLSATALSEFLQPGKAEMIKGTLSGARNLARDRQGEREYGMPWSHLALELAGVAYGPVAYLLERRRGPRAA
jgi:GT2 family glycosyltransferase